MRRRSPKHTFVTGQRVRSSEGHEAVILAIWDDALKLDFITGPREGMLPLVDDASKYKPA